MKFVFEASLPDRSRELIRMPANGGKFNIYVPNRDNNRKVYGVLTVSFHQRYVFPAIF